MRLVLHLLQFLDNNLFLQHILLFEPDADKNTNRIGMIDPACKVKSVIMEAFQNAAFLCEEYYDCAPEIEIKGWDWLVIYGLFDNKLFQDKR